MDIQAKSKKKEEEKKKDEMEVDETGLILAALLIYRWCSVIVLWYAYWLACFFPAVAVHKEEKKEEKKDDKKDDKQPEKKEEKKEPEPDFELLHNPARVTASQAKCVVFEKSARYTPLKKVILSRFSPLGQLRLSLAHLVQNESVRFLMLSSSSYRQSVAS